MDGLIRKNVRNECIWIIVYEKKCSRGLSNFYEVHMSYSSSHLSNGHAVRWVDELIVRRVLVLQGLQVAYDGEALLLGADREVRLTVS